MNSSNFENILQISEIFEFKKIFIFFIGILAIHLVNKGLGKIGKKASAQMPTKRLLILQFVTILVFLIYVIGVFLLFYHVLKPSKELLLAIGVSVAVALGLALKDIASSLVCGLILLFDQSFQVGDRVTFDGEYGEILSIGLRTVRMNTLDDDTVTIPNSRFLTDVVSSGNSGNNYMMVVVNFYLALDCDLKMAKRIIHEAIMISKYSYLKMPVTIVIEEEKINGIIALKLSAKSYVFDVKYEKAFQSDIVAKVEEWFIEKEVKRPVFNFSNA